MKDNAMKPQYRIRDKVFVRRLDDLIEEFGEYGNDIDTPSNFVYYGGKRWKTKN